MVWRIRTALFEQPSLCSQPDTAWDCEKSGQTPALPCHLFSQPPLFKLPVARSQLYRYEKKRPKHHGRDTRFAPFFSKVMAQLVL
ncbi:hypothetical protein BaRGS_00016240 [Batillaria attramentaria]|uniref:Uncharacterized protein n=1 Tax=Batillaria attramentaria TaxID=370345 RepID=A0ABD0KZG9_9CAEN